MKEKLKMKSDSAEFLKLVKQNEMLEAKKVFEQSMNSKVVSTITEFRKEVAKNFFNKTENGHQKTS
jgi:hypothetical protein